VVRVLIVGDIRVYRDGLGHALSRDPRFEVVGSAGTAGDGAALIRNLRPDVTLIDMAMVDAHSGLRLLRDAGAGTRILALAVQNAESDVLACAEIGVSGFVTRDQSLEVLCEALIGATRGEACCSPVMTGSLLRRIAALSAQRSCVSSAAELTRREEEILGLIGKGMSNKAIAAQLCIEVCTVKNHVHNILEKLGASSRTQAAAIHRAAFV
jgi:two-component system, NarL family, nitrate/nitrite response regulator NarL